MPLSTEMKSFLLALANLLEEHQAIIEAGDYCIDIGCRVGKKIEWLGFELGPSVEEESLRGFVNK